MPSAASSLPGAGGRGGGGGRGGESDVGGTRGQTWIMVARGRPRELIRPRRPRCILNSIEVYMKAYEDLKLHTPEHSSTQTGTIEATERQQQPTHFSLSFRFAAKFGRIFSGAATLQSVHVFVSVCQRSKGEASVTAPGFAASPRRSRRAGKTIGSGADTDALDTRGVLPP